jgi:hypothetical protein
MQNPRYYVPILIMILFAAAFTGFQYVAASKVYDEKTLPSISAGDVWTENRTFWTSNASVVISESDDSLGGGYYGNKSIEFSVVDGNQIWAQLTPAEAVNCSGLDGFKNMSFRIKPIYPDTTQPINASIYLLSGQTGYFYYNLTGVFVSFTEPIWYNQTIDVGPGSGWTSSNGNVDWGNITSVGFKFEWSDNANITLRIDGVVFRGVFVPIIDNVALFLFDFSFRGLLQFVLEWVILAGLLYLLIKGFKGNIVWKPLIILIGSALITILIQEVINVVAFSTLPTIYRPLELFSGVEGEYNVAAAKIMDQIALVNQIYSLVQIGVFVWTIALCALATRSLTEFSLTKSFLIASAAYFVSIIVANFILGYTV